MKFYQLGFRYLQRKKGKTILLLIVLILVNSMILGTSMILRTTNESKQAMQEKTNSKIVAEITNNTQHDTTKKRSHKSGSSCYFRGMRGYISISKSSGFRRLPGTAIFL